MSIFSKLPWKIISGFVPAIGEIVKQAQNFSENDKNPELESLKSRISALESESVKVRNSFMFVLAGGIVIFLIAAAGLTLGIISLTR
ncbi:MAG TPA: hypothetical protein DEE98_07575 [Elusimicrobia bacterium]|nr:MAG: hypothetical protein A2278_00415 [Elusimicrobia bacterium RIFOXYA12_FULL_49_49]OGS06623.1 MAG: hypothetical protein A2204_00325 [Elusimicrobia bacterium RIFOXYA1_FULL_47_7]OGS11038.1 MAG: hypothetical protein A2386_00500 [Elusimicrobia bacterium RIFOXYB1_FULL_48_9]OGS15123.1 MAG: hypothetical protein A2251_00425 [Elusimicrobia bacterium RIFOXYA2_FULL_47_53]OGS29743.1 MAG: hypothetical protein A2323_01225 [Elusimicrobia bacterium RIFOXYB2_FULL_46_23]HBU70222.1 hypothetical protein [Elus